MEVRVALGAMRHTFPNPIIFYIIAFLFTIIATVADFKDRFLYSQASTSVYWNSIGNKTVNTKTRETR
jgi:hypothetical protein